MPSSSASPYVSSLSLQIRQVSELLDKSAPSDSSLSASSQSLLRFTAKSGAPGGISSVVTTLTSIPRPRPYPASLSAKKVFFTRSRRS